MNGELVNMTVAEVAARAAEEAAIRRPAPKVPISVDDLVAALIRKGLIDEGDV
ncbi:MAG: hypothetical protein IT531_24670 [Burkholderiales bacterium]|nr:hypothetical protein [Burkholderiales bacterium]